MFKIKIPRLTTGPCMMSLKEWAYTMGFAQIIPFALAAGKCFHYYSVDHQTGSNTSMSLTLAIICTIHLKFVITLIVGQVTKNVKLLYIWIGYTVIESVALTTLSIVFGIMAINEEQTGLGMGITTIIVGPIFGFFNWYCILTVYSLICIIKENERKIDMLELGNNHFGGMDHHNHRTNDVLMGT